MSARRPARQIRATSCITGRRFIETPAAVQYAAEKLAELRHGVGNEIDIAIDFRGAISPATAKRRRRGSQEKGFRRLGAQSGRDATPQSDGRRCNFHPAGAAADTTESRGKLNFSASPRLGDEQSLPY